MAMGSPVDLPEDVEAAKTLLHRGRLEDFVAERDALVRRLREADRRDDATAVKQLRKPSRPAWVLDAAVFADADAVEQVAAAVNEVVEAQAGRGEMRAATTSLRDAVQSAASRAAAIAAEAGVSVDRASLVPMVLAVIADQDAFAALRRGHLTEIPSAGGLDVLTNPPELLSAPQRSRPLSVVEPEPEDPAAVKRARAKLAAAEEAAADAHDRLTAAETASDQAKQRFDAAEDALHAAETEARDARRALHDAQQDVRAATRDAREADRAVAAARRRVPEPG